MKIDGYTKAVLTGIAILLGFIAFDYKPRMEAEAGMMGSDEMISANAIGRTASVLHLGDAAPFIAVAEARIVALFVEHRRPVSALKEGCSPRPRSTSLASAGERPTATVRQADCALSEAESDDISIRLHSHR